MPPTNRFPFWRYLAPRHWPTWIGLGFMRVAASLPFAWQLALGRGLGRLVYRLAGGRRRVAEINLSLCFPRLDAAERAALLRENFESSMIAVFETALSWWGSDAQLKNLQRLEGLDHLREALAGGKGVILLGGHYTTIEISGRLMGYHARDIFPIYKPAHNPLFDAVMARARKRVFDDMLDNSDMRAILRTLKAGKIIWYAPDQDFGRERSVFAPFFGVPTATLVTTARLARLSGAPVLPFSSERLPGTEGYVLRVGAPLANFPSGDDVADATAVNGSLEAQVRRIPAQYLWLHKRFKTRPAGEPDLYRRGR